MEENKSFSKAPGYYHWVFVIFIDLFVYLFIFSLNKFLLTTLNKNLLQFKSFKIIFICRSSPQRSSPERRCFADVVGNFRGRTVRRCSFNKVAKRLCLDHARIAPLHCCSPEGLLHVCKASFSESTSLGLLLNKDNFMQDF